MKTYPLTANDFALIDEAKRKISCLYEDDKHHIGAALQTQSGSIASAVHIEAYVGRVAVCAEAIAIGSAISTGDKYFDTIVAVSHPYSNEEDRELKVVSPCGMCRELIFDYSPECFVILEIDEKLQKTKIGELIPLKYKREI
ncbi:cytidine deaminase [Priestia taiwanensis]|uniref:Cytidine deaminase n=1 Tax=Priestia taiwanensis TaxID=1347902 RepID=A0A917EM38_9BACI|nr:cytidine deaminase [Priestia taiwanensis]MBM7362398.1 cytidine deaminase [Priestia taiwanensis]GGE61955.1 cytidine deaminase [Priestia taiwanensis]